MKLIKLTKGQWAKVSDHRYEHLMQWKWHARWNEKSQTFYATRNQNLAAPGEPWINSMVAMHRYVLGLKKGERNAEGRLLQGLHGDGDGLNNQDDNLTRGTNSQNSMNRKEVMANNTSGFKGVSFRKTVKSKPWWAFVKVNGKMIWLGGYALKEHAIAARLAGEKVYYGEFARARSSPTLALVVSL